MAPNPNKPLDKMTSTEFRQFKKNYKDKCQKDGSIKCLYPEIVKDWFANVLAILKAREVVRDEAIMRKVKKMDKKMAKKSATNIKK